MRSLGYLARAVGIVATAAFALGWYGLRWAESLGEPRRDAELARLRGLILRRTLGRLGATFIKLGQVMSTRPDLFRPELVGELKLLQDRLDPFPGARARRQIERELGRPIDEVFSELDEAPVAAASVAQVHRGRLRDGTEVAVKVLRPDIRAKTERDGSILRALAAAAQRLSAAARHANLVGHCDHFLEGVLAQTDLRTEADNYARFRANFADVDHIAFPRVYPEASGETVMAMDFIHGRKVDDVPPEQREQTAARLRRAFLKMLFDDGFLHADLHPGNLLVTEDGRIAIFDVGLATRMSEELLEQYIDFNKCLVMGTGRDFVEHLRRFHAYTEGAVDWDELTRDATRFVGSFRGKPASELEFGTIIEDVFALARRYGIRPVTDMTLIMVGLVTAEGMGKQLSPDSDSFGEVASYLMPILARRGMMPDLGGSMASQTEHA